MPRNSSLPSDLLLRVKTGSQTVAQLATQLSRQISSFEDWLNQLPGKVEAQCFGPDPTDKSKCLVLGYARGLKGSWGLFAGTAHRAENGEPSYVPTLTPLPEMSIEIKVGAIKLFSNLLESILVSQQERSARLEIATSAFDEVAESIGLKEGK